MDRQKLFDTAAKALIEQGCKAVQEDAELCAYRGVNGTKCAIGHMIPDSIYKPSMEGYPINELAVSTSNNFSKEVADCLGVNLDNKNLMHSDVDFLIEIQDAHDRVGAASGQLFVSTFKANMEQVATDYGLDNSILD